MSEKTQNIYQKLQECRVELSQKKLKKTGKNSHNQYTYYELGDFLPAANEIMLQRGLMAIFKPNLPGDDIATLTVVNLEDVNDRIIFASSVAVAKLSGCQEVQNIGATQTYMRRYLYIMALEVAESDAIEPLTGTPPTANDEISFDDASAMKISFGKHKGKTLIEIFEKHPDYVEWFFSDGKDDKVKSAFQVISDYYKSKDEEINNQFIDEVKVKTLSKLIEETQTDEPKFCEFCHVEALEEITNAGFSKAMKLLTDKKAKMPKDQSSEEERPNI